MRDLRDLDQSDVQADADRAYDQWVASLGPWQGPLTEQEQAEADAYDRMERQAHMVCRKAKRGDTVVLMDGSEFEVVSAQVNGDVYLLNLDDTPHGPYDTTEYCVLEEQL